MIKLAIVLLLFPLNITLAQREPLEPPGSRFDGPSSRGGLDGGNWSPPSINAANFGWIGAMPSNVQYQNIDQDLRKKLRFSPILEVNTNRGSLHTGFSIPLPPNLLGMNGLEFKYNSSLPFNIGLGAGWELGLPFIQLGQTLLQSSTHQVKGLGDSNLVLSSENVDQYLNLAQMIFSKAGGKDKIKQMRPYRAGLEGSFHLYLRLIGQRSIHGWLTLTLDGKRWLFDVNGLPILLTDTHGNTIEFSWVNGALERIFSREEGWEVQLKYKEVKSFRAHLGKLYELPMAIDRITTFVGNQSKTYQFQHQGEYLLSVLSSDDFTPLFQGEYQELIGGLAESRPNNIKQTDDKQLIFFDDLNAPRLRDELAHDSPQIEMYVDLNSDGRDDRISIRTDEFNNLIKHHMGRIQYVHTGSSSSDCVMRPKTDGNGNIIADGAIVNESILRDLPLKVEMAVWDGSNTNYVEDTSLNFKHLTVPFFKVRIPGNRKRHPECNAVYELGVVLERNGIHFEDLNNDGRKDILVCPYIGALEEKRVRIHETKGKYQSNLILSVLDYLGNVRAQKKSFSKTLNTTGERAKVYLQVPKEKELRQEWERLKGTPNEIAHGNFVTNMSGWREVPVSFNCHQYSFLSDLNKDGYVDVVNGRSAYLLDAYQGSQSVDVKLEDIFEQGDEDLNPDAENLTLVDLDGDGKLEPRAINSVKSHPLLGTMEVLRPGQSETHVPNLPYKVLSKYRSHFGGHHSVSYKFHSGRWVAQKITRDPVFGNQPSSTTEYLYETPIRDPYSGLFIGFYKTKEVKQTNHPDVPKVVVDRVFYKDVHPSVVLFHERGRINGELLREEIYEDEHYSHRKTNINEIEFISIAPDRTLPLTKRNTEILFSGSNGINVKETINTVEIDEQIGIPTFNIVELLSHKNPMSLFSQSDLDFYEKKTTFLGFIPQLYKSYPKEITLEDGEGIAPRHPIKIEVDEGTGEVSSYLKGSRGASFTYDDKGRLIQENHTNGKVVSAEYGPLSPLPIKVSDNATTKSLRFNRLTGQLEQLRWRDVTYKYSYIGDFLTQIRRGTSIRPFTELHGLSLPEKINCQDQDEATDRFPYICYNLNLFVRQNGHEKEYQLDGFGRVINMAQTIQGKTHFSGAITYSEDDQILTQMYPSFDQESSQVLTRNKFDFLGRVVLNEQYSEIPMTTVKTYPGLCEESTLNSILTTKICRNIRGHVVSSQLPNEKVQLEVNSVGDIKGIPSLGYGWDIDLNGDVLGFNAEKENENIQISSHYNSQNVSEQGNVITTADGLELTFDELSRFRSSKRISQNSLLEFFEEVKYNGELKSSHSFVDPNGSLLKENNYEYNDLGEVNSIISNFTSTKLSYDNYGRIESEQISLNDVETSSLDFSYVDSLVASVKPHISKVVYGQSLLIEEIHYKNGIKLIIERDLGSLLIKSITYLAKDKIIWQESLSYNKLGKVNLKRKRSINGETTTQIPYTSNFEVASNLKALPSVTYNNGNLISLENNKFNWLDSNLVHSTDKNENHYYFYDYKGKIEGGCKEPIKNKSNQKDCFIRLDDNSFIIGKRFVKIHKIKSFPVLLQIDAKFWPIVADYLGSVRGIIDTSQQTLIFERNYSVWGVKEVNFRNEDFPKEIERLCVWEFANLIASPLSEENSTQLFWSQSRIYSPYIEKWLSVDPLLKWHPNKLSSIPGDWHNTRYSNNDPVNYIDPSGHNSMVKSMLMLTAFGAFAGGFTAKSTGSNIGKGALVGATTGLLLGSGSAMVQPLALAGKGAALANSSISGIFALTGNLVGQMAFTDQVDLPQSLAAGVGGMAASSISACLVGGYNPLMTELGTSLSLLPADITLSLGINEISKPNLSRVKDGQAYNSDFLNKAFNNNTKGH